MIKQKPQIMSPEKAEILGLLCAEGSHYNYITVYNEFFKNRGKYYTLIRNVEAIEFTNLNERLLQHFRTLMLKVYDYAPRPTGVKTSMKIRIKKKSVIKDLLKYTDFGCMKWKVPEILLKSSTNSKKAFIRGLFDGDGTIGLSYIRLSSVNGKAIKNVYKLLKFLDINSKIRGPYQQKGNRKQRYDLVILKSDILKYKNIIHSNHEEKANKLCLLGA